MYKIGDYVIYLKDVCKIFDIKEKYMNDTDYYILVPINDESLKLSVPVTNETLKNLPSLNEVNAMLDNICNISVLTEENKQLEDEYKKLISSGSYEDLIKVMKTAYLRNKKRLDNKRSISSKDKNYMEMAEKHLIPELAIVLDMSIDETEQYVINKLCEGIDNA